MRALAEKPYDEDEATVDALAGRKACRHGHWPHQGIICVRCAVEGIAKVTLQALSEIPEDGPVRLPNTP